eukprot:m.229009 g.229009  ORF g.229009 m.229009 type:complete len:496 (-) comp15201_c0_seq2:264-1751(-)
MAMVQVGALDIPNELWIHILSFVDDETVFAFACACKQFAMIVESDAHWYERLALRLPPRLSISPDDSFQLQYKSGKALRDLKRGKWVRPTMLGDALAAVEGHSMVLWRKHFLLIFHGWGNFGIQQAMYMVDLSGLPEMTRRINVVQRGHIHDVTYGHAMTALEDGRILLHGGCCSGGYSEQTDAMFIGQVEMDADGSSATVTWQPVDIRDEGSPGLSFCTRVKPRLGPTSYHAIVSTPAYQNLVFFVGGLDRERGVSDSVSVLDLEQMEWRPVHQQPDADVARYGHACGIIDGQLVIAGGCNGFDIRRDGHDKRSIYTMDVEQLVDRGVAEWTKVCDTPPDMFGRELAFGVLGRRLVAFGGSVNHMEDDEVVNTIFSFDTETQTLQQMEMYIATDEGDDSDGAIARACLSAEGVIYDRYFVVHGGWTPHGLQGGLFVADMCLPSDHLDALTAVDREMDRGHGRVFGNGGGGGMFNLLMQLLMQQGHGLPVHEYDD